MSIILKEEMNAYQDLLNRNNLFKKLPEVSRDDLVAQAVRFGADIAQKISVRHGKLLGINDIRDLIQAYGANLELTQSHFTSFCLAEYNENTAGIQCYIENINRLEQHLIQRGEYHPDPYPLLALCMLHEMFHHIEVLGHTTTSQCFIMVRTLFFNRRYSPVTLREVAAHSFVKEILGLEKSPVLFRLKRA